MKKPEIHIKAQAKNNAYSLILIGIMSMLFVLFIASFYWLQAKFVLIFLLLISFVIIFIGIAKALEPITSLVLVPQYLRYQHKYGYWQLSWQDIAHIDQVSESVWLETIKLPYVGLRLHQFDAIIDNISPRLASRLIHEHRPLIHFCIQHKLITFEEGIINFTPFKINKRIIKGPKAAFLHQMAVLKSALGYHLYLPESALDRKCSDFITLLKDCQQGSKNYTQ